MRESKKEETHHFLGYSDWQEGIFYMHHSTDKIVYTESICNTSSGALAGTKSSSIVPPRGIDLMTHHTLSSHTMSCPND